jgi:hypothetical protein
LFFAWNVGYIQASAGELLKVTAQKFENVAVVTRKNYLFGGRGWGWGIRCFPQFFKTKTSRILGGNHKGPSVITRGKMMI